MFCCRGSQEWKERVNPKYVTSLLWPEYGLFESFHVK